MPCQRHYAALAAAAMLVAFVSVSAWASHAPPPSADILARSASGFLESLGINLHVDQGYDPAAYVAPLRYTGIREVRDGPRHPAGDIMIHRQTGVRFALSAGGDLDGLLAAARVLSREGALLALEGPNEPNNFPIVYRRRPSGRNDWAPVAQFQKDLYQAVRDDPVLKRYPVFGTSETGAQPQNFGLQFLAIPSGAMTLLPAGTRFADYANIHNYVIGNGRAYGNNQAWNAADPVLDARWDGLYGNIGTTWSKRFAGYPAAQLPRVPRVTTETGWDTTSDPGGQASQGTILVNTYLAQFKRGWRYTFIYELVDGQGSTGHQGIYGGSDPKLSAVYIHNLTTILSDQRAVAVPARLRYAIPDQPATVHDLLLQKSSGELDLVIWDERVTGQDDITVRLAKARNRISVFDVTKGTAPIAVLKQTAVVPLTLTDHAMILTITH